jgi:hypothetical protein
MKKFFVRFTYGFFNDSPCQNEGSFIFSGSELTDRLVVERCEQYVWERISLLNKAGHTGLQPKIGIILQLNPL